MSKLTLTPTSWLPSLPPALPDLVLDSISLMPSSGSVAGDHVTFSAVARNQGAGPTPSGIGIGITWEVDGAPVNWTTNTDGPLAPGATRTLTASNGVSGSSYWVSTAGAHTVSATVNDGNTIIETDTSNNTASKSFTIASSSSSSGSGKYPADNSTVGWRGAGLTLADLTPSGSITVTTNNTVISGKDVTGTITINSGVTGTIIENGRVTHNGSNSFAILNHGTGTIIRYMELTSSSPGSGTAGVAFSNFTVDHCDISQFEDGLKGGSNTVITNNLIHNLYRLPGTSHNDCIQCQGGSNVLIQYNNLHNDYSETSCVHIKSDTSLVTNVTVDSNLFNGGGYEIYGGNETTTYGVSSAIKITNNAFGRDVFSTGGAVGPYTKLCSDSASEFSGNYWADTGAAL